MKRKFNTEIVAGLFLLLGIAALAYLSIKLGRLEFFGNTGYTVNATFDNAGGIKAGSVVEIAGVEIGRVEELYLEDYQAKILMRIQQEIKLQEDCIASIKTKGLIGEKFISLTPGGSDEIIGPGGTIRETESFVGIFELISKYAFGKI